MSWLQATCGGEEGRSCDSMRVSTTGLEILAQSFLIFVHRTSFFHIDCYKCKKCQDSIEINDRVLLDFDGLPLCEHCFHKCTSCKLSISDSKIVFVNNNSYYHSACFLCKKCSQVLDEKRFAKTKQSIYCTDCYQKRVAKLKRKAEKKVERERLVYDGVAPS
jgi:hypothetical protein